MNCKRRILSGMRPTGRLHLGHLVGVIDCLLEFQGKDECFLEIANLHALTDRTDYTHVNESILEMTLDWLAAGIDPNKSTIFVQSLVPEHTELYTIFSMITPVSWLEGSPVYKDIISKEGNKKIPTFGLLGYPVLQAADIALYKSTHVPVGEDQAPHLELTREIIRRFNTLFGNVFPEPQTILTKTPRLLGTDGRKMSKSYNNFISPIHNLETLKEKTRKMITDPKKIRKNDPGNPMICSVYMIHDYYNPQKDIVAQECRDGQRGCVDCKMELSNVLYNTFSEFREKRNFYEKRLEEVKDILYNGSKKARQIAKETLEETLGIMNIKY